MTFWRRSKPEPEPEPPFRIYAKGPDTLSVTRIPYYLYGMWKYERQEGEADADFVARVTAAEEEALAKRTRLAALVDG